MAGIQLSDNNHTFEPVIADKLQNAGNNIKVVIVPQYSRAPPCWGGYLPIDFEREIGGHPWSLAGL